MASMQKLHEVWGSGFKPRVGVRGLGFTLVLGFRTRPEGGDPPLLVSSARAGNVQGSAHLSC